MPRDQVEEYEMLRSFVAPGELRPHLPAPVDPVLELLVKARAFLASEKNWCKGSYGTNDGRRCAHGALMTDDMDLYGRARDALTAALPKGCGHFMPMGFNDAPSTAHADVLALFDRAIEARKAATS